MVLLLQQIIVTILQIFILRFYWNQLSIQICDIPGQRLLTIFFQAHFLLIFVLAVAFVGINAGDATAILMLGGCTDGDAFLGFPFGNLTLSLLNIADVGPDSIHVLGLVFFGVIGMLSVGWFFYVGLNADGRLVVNVWVRVQGLL